MNGKNYSVLIADFRFHRLITRQILSVYIPSFLIVSLTWLTFWMGMKSSSERMTLSLTNMLAMLTYFIESRNNLPVISYVNASRPINNEINNHSSSSPGTR